MTPLDYVAIGLYFILVVGVGFYYARRAARGLDAYFLGGRGMHWLALAMSGSVSNFDITGTMWIISILYVLGMKSMWHHWMWGFLMGAFFLSYMGKWVRRSNVMTAAEWMETRFGSGAAGRLARVTAAAIAVLLTMSFIGYAFTGIGKFASVYIPLERLARHTDSVWIANLVTNHEATVLALAIISLTTLYVLVGGLYGVVVTDVVQTVILTAGSIVVACIAWAKLTPQAMASLPADWTSLRVPWRIDALAGTENARFQFFGAMVMVWVAKGLLLNLGGPAQMYDAQRFLAARHARDAAPRAGRGKNRSGMERVSDCAVGDVRGDRATGNYRVCRGGRFGEGDAGRTHGVPAGGDSGGGDRGTIRGVHVDVQFDGELWSVVHHSRYLAAVVWRRQG